MLFFMLPFNALPPFCSLFPSFVLQSTPILPLYSYSPTHLYFCFLLDLFLSPFYKFLHFLITIIISLEKALALLPLGETRVGCALVHFTNKHHEEMLLWSIIYYGQYDIYNYLFQRELNPQNH